MNASLASRLGSQLISLLLLFSIVYNVNFLIFPSATMGRLAVLYMLWKQRNTIGERIQALAEKHPYVLLILTGLLAHAAVGYLAGGREDSTQMSRQFHFLFYSLLASYLYAAHIEGDMRVFLRNFGIVTALQGALIVYSLFSPEYREWLAGLLVQNSNFPLTSATRPPGFSTSSGASLSVIQSLGVYCCICIAFAPGPRWVKVLSSLGAIISISSTILAGRTGLMMSALFIGAFCLRDLFRLRWGSTAVVAGFLALLVFQGPVLVDYLMANRGDDLPNFQKISEWAFEFFMNDGDVYSVYDLQTMPVPGLSFDTMVGTGLVENGSRNDSGYIQNYYSLGLLMSILFYGTALYMCFRMWLVSKERFLSLVLIGGIFFVEVKEPFVLKYIYVFFIISQYYMLADTAAVGGKKHDQLLAQ
jgi:hypothetical protein